VHKKGNGKDSHENQNDQRNFKVLEDKFLDFVHPHSLNEKFIPSLIPRLKAWKQSNQEFCLSEQKTEIFIPSGKI